jgi:hypothetical protein
LKSGPLAALTATEMFSPNRPRAEQLLDKDIPRTVASRVGFACKLTALQALPATCLFRSDSG